MLSYHGIEALDTIAGNIEDERLGNGPTAGITTRLLKRNTALPLIHRVKYAEYEPHEKDSRAGTYSRAAAVEHSCCYAEAADSSE